ncbi:MAG: response regulator [Oceanicaulis sp.]
MARDSDSDTDAGGAAEPARASAPPAEAVLEAMDELVLVRDGAGRVVSVNTAFLSAFGGARADWIGRWFAVAPAFGDDGAARRYDAAMRTRAGPAWIEWSETPTPDGGAVAVGRDVSRERTARAEESEAARGKSIFFASVTHELRTPLSGALGAAALLEETGLRPDQAAYLDAVRSSAAHALNLIDDILDITRLEAGRLELREESVDPRALIEDVAEILAPRAAEKGLSLAHAIAADVPERVRADPARLRQVLFNLAGNAVKFTTEGGVLISAELTGERLRLSVRDTGPGVSKADQARLFEYFERGSAERTAAPGAGIGLAMVRRLAEAMDGAVGVRSETGRGALFWFEAPLPAEAPPPSARPLSGRVTLVASPDMILREALRRQCAALGGQSLDAADPEQALRIVAQAQGPITVLLDEAWADLAKGLKEAAPGARVLAVAQPRTKDQFAPGQRPPEFDGWLVAPVRLASLALYAAGAGIAEPPPAPAPAARDAAKPLSGLRVLLAEDDPVNSMIARTVLTRLGAEAVHVADGRAAAEAAAMEVFDAALLDLRMPELDGQGVARAIRSLPGAGAALPIIALTANATEEDRAACLAAGMDDFLTKPLDPDALVRTLTRLCGDRNRASFG